MRKKNQINNSEQIRMLHLFPSRVKRRKFVFNKGKSKSQMSSSHLCNYLLDETSPLLDFNSNITSNNDNTNTPAPMALANACLFVHCHFF